MALPDGPGPALQRYALDELGAAIDALEPFGGRLHAGVHRSRKAMRRSRAVLALGGDAMGPGGRLIDRALRKANRGLSDLRDAHALVETLERLLDRASDEDARVHLHRARHQGLEVGPVGRPVGGLVVVGELDQDLSLIHI